MNTHESMPLWSGNAPGEVADPKRANEPAAKESPRLVPYPLHGGAARATVIVCPGGGYGVRAPHEADPVALWLNSLGIASFVCHYRVSPFRHPAPLHDAQRCVRLVRSRAKEWNIDPARVGILGFSAGGHLACSVANFGDDGDARSDDAVERQPSRVQACIGCYPVISYGEHGHKGSFINLLGERPEAALSERMSLERSVSGRNPPTFLWHTADDQAVSLQNPLLYAAALAAKQVPVSLHVYPKGPHGLGLAQDFAGTARGWTGACAEWLQEIGFR